MTEHDSLVRAICDQPDDDTPRLIYADYLDEIEEPERAVFIRSQVDLACTPTWEPFAVFCRYRKSEWSDGSESFRDSLPRLPEHWDIDWHKQAFHRGLGWRVNIRSLIAWNEIAAQLFQLVPIGCLYLKPAATLDEWRQFGEGEWLRFLRVVHFDGASPVEPIRVLCQSSEATGITDIHFHRASSPGLPFLVEDLLRSPLSRSLRGLHFRIGYESIDYLIDSLGTADGSVALERLTLAVMGLGSDQLGRLLQIPLLRDLAQLDLRDNWLGSGSSFLIEDSVLQRIHSLGLAGTEVSEEILERLTHSERSSSIRQLDLSRNSLAQGMRILASSRSLSGLRSLLLRKCNLTGGEIAHLVQSHFWPNLVELDLRENRLSHEAIQHLVTAPIPEELTAIVVNGVWLDESAITLLRDHFGDRFVLDRGD